MCVHARVCVCGVYFYVCACVHAFVCPCVYVCMCAVVHAYSARVRALAMRPI